jgi:Na+/H+ antiporter NhaD/arsenite permease-like protein
MVIFAIFRKNLTSEVTPHPIEDEQEVDRARLWAVVAITLGALVGFALSETIGVQTYVVALTAGVLALIVVMTKSPKNIVWAAKKINWTILVFFIGLFILMGAVETSGLLDEIASLFPGFGGGGVPSALGVAAFSTVLSNLVSNVPAVMLIGNMLPEGNMLLWFTLAASSTLAGNATLIASAVNVIVSERAETEGITFSFWKFALIGIPVTAVTLLVAVGMLMLMF